MAQFTLSDSRIRVRIARLADGDTLRAIIEFPDAPDAEKNLLELINRFLLGSNLPERASLTAETKEAQR